MIKHSVNFRHPTHNVSKIEQKIPHFSKQTNKCLYTYFFVPFLLYALYRVKLKRNSHVIRIYFFTLIQTAVS